MSPAVLLALALFGCSAMPQSTRVVPRTADIRTRLQPGRDPIPEVASTLATNEAPDDPNCLLNTRDEVSPLPPALPKTVLPIELPPSLPTNSSTVTSPRPEPAPTLDEASTRAEVPHVAIVGAVAKPTADTVVAKPEPKAAPLTTPKAEISAVPDPLPEPIHPAPAPEARPVVSAPLKPEEIWREGVEVLRSVARDRLKDRHKEAKPGSPNWALRERLLDWLAEPEVNSSPTTSADAAQERAILKGLAAVLDPSTPAESRGAEIRDTITTLEAQAPLEITELRLCRTVQGFGTIEPLEPPARKAGQSVILYCEIAGLAYESAGGVFRSRVAAEVELIAEGSKSPGWTHSLGTAEDTCRRYRRDFFIGHKFSLPESLASGNYRLRLTEKDLVTNRAVSSETSITVTR